MTKTISLFGAMFILTLGTAAQAQDSCTDGQVFDPDLGTCVIDPDGGGGGGGGGTDADLPTELRFLTPEDGSEFAAGTAVTPTGRTSLALVENKPLDLTIVLDRSLSMTRQTVVPNDETPNPNDTLNNWELVSRAVEGLLNVLPAEAQLTIVDFASDVGAITTKGFATSSAISGRALERGADLIRMADYVNALTPDGTTRTDLALRATYDIYNSSITDFPAEDYDREILLLSDGVPSTFVQGQFLTAFGFYGDVTTVSLPGNVEQGNQFLEQLATIGGGRFLDYSTDSQGFLDAFTGSNTLLPGVTSLDITDPDGRVYGVETDALGQFILEPFALNAGENIFTATALFEDGSSKTSTLTLTGTGGLAPVPLPAAAWMLLIALGSLGALGRRRMA